MSVRKDSPDFTLLLTRSGTVNLLGLLNGHLSTINARASPGNIRVLMSSVHIVRKTVISRPERPCEEKAKVQSTQTIAG